MQKHLYILTAAIEPLEVPTLQRTDWSQRRADYEDALSFYAKDLDPEDASILLIENTGADITSLHEIAAANHHHLECISYSEEPSVSARGKGNGEALMFDRVGNWLRTREPLFKTVTKITGRLKILNHDAILKTCEHAGSFVSCRVSIDLARMDTKYFITDPFSWQRYVTNLEPLIDERNEIYLEHAAALRFSQARFDGLPWIKFRSVPNIRGVSGSTGVSYGGLKERLREQFGVTALRIASDRGYL